MYVTGGMEGVIQSVYRCVQVERGITGVILQYNSGSVAATLNKSPFQYVYFSLGYCVFTSF